MKTKSVQKIKSLGAIEKEIFVLNDEVAYACTRVRTYACTHVRMYARTHVRTYVRKNRDIEGAPLLKNRNGLQKIAKHCKVEKKF